MANLNVKAFEKAFGRKLTSEELDSEFRVAIDLMGIPSLSFLNGLDEWIDFLNTCNVIRHSHYHIARNAYFNRYPSAPDVTDAYTD